MAISIALVPSFAPKASAQERLPDQPNMESDARTHQSATALNEIVVTARKVAENLQDVPVAITAFTGETLTSQNAMSLADVQRLTPSLLIRPGTLSPASLTFAIRGQVNIDALASSDPSVGVYLDGVYIARAYGIDANLLDIQSLQVLKGPQGTLFGRNTTGGAILLQTNDPDLSDTSGELALTYGRFDYKSATAVINLPLVTDKAALRAAVEIADSDGYHVDTISGERSGEKDRWNARVKLLLKPTDTLSLLLSAEGYGHKGNAAPWFPYYFSPQWGNAALTAGVNQLGQSACFGDLEACKIVGFDALDQDIANASKNPNRTGTSYPNHVNIKTRTYMATASLDTDFGEIRFVNGHRKVGNDNCQDMDGTPASLYGLCSRQRLKQFSSELIFTGKGFDNRVEFAAGAFYFSEQGTDQSRGQAYGAPLNSSVTLYYGDVDNNSIGLYGQVNVKLDDRLTFTGGLRWSSDRKGIIVNNRTQNIGTIFDPPIGGTVNPSLPIGVTLRCDLNRCPDRRADEFTGVSYTVGFDYQLTDDVLLYAKTARGFRSGGQNLRASAAVGDINPFVPFKPEIATSYEGGIKSELFDRRLRVNVAGYLVDMKDIQRRSVVVANGGATTVLGNADKAEIYGGEVEANLSVFDGFQLAGTLAYVHPEYKDYVNPFTGFDRHRDRFDGVAKWQYSISAIYAREFDFGKLALRTDWAWLGAFALNDINYYVDAQGVARSTSDGSAFPSVAIAEAITNNLTSKSGGELSARGSLSFDDDRYEIAIWGRNLTNNRRAMTGTYLNTIAVSGNLAEPRTYGVTLSGKF